VNENQPETYTEGWHTWSKFVLKELERQAKDSEDIKAEQREIRTEQIEQGKKVARLEVKAGVWGILGGVFTMLVYLISEMIKKGNI